MKDCIESITVTPAAIRLIMKAERRRFEGVGKKAIKYSRATPIELKGRYIKPLIPSEFWGKGARR